jgi:hypothetical protein
MFQQPAQGDQVKVADLLGSLTLIWVRDYREEIVTSFGPKDAVAVDIHVLDGPKGGEKFDNVFLFQGALIGSLRSAAGGEPVLARIGQGIAKPNQSAPYVLLPYTADDAALATAYIARMPKPFQAAGNGAAPVNSAAAATADNSWSPAADAAALDAARARADATAPVSSRDARRAAEQAVPAAAASTAVDAATFGTLPDEVKELLRQSGAAPF